MAASERLLIICAKKCLKAILGNNANSSFSCFTGGKVQQLEFDNLSHSSF